MTSNQLDREIIEHDLHSLAGCFDNYKDYLTKLRLTEAEQADVRREEFLEDSRQSAVRKALSLWRKSDPYAATFRALLEVVLSLSKHQVAEDICKYISDNVPA